MVGLVSNTHLTSTESKPKKMCDSSEIVDENMDTLEKNDEISGPDKKPEEDAPEKMDLDEDQCTSTLSDEPNKETKENNDKTARRKSRSSRSVSTNSTCSANVNPSEEKEEKKETKVETNSEEEDFFGFDLGETEKSKVESSIDQYKKARLANSQNAELSESAAGESSKEKDKTVNSEVSPDKTETGSEMEASSGLETSSTPVNKKTPRGNKKTPGVDLSNPEFRKPFEFGWVRELVYRSTTDNSLRRNADIYYYTPQGKKVRSSREILEHLSGNDLSIDNFTFFKGAIGIDDPSKEIIREAKTKPGPRGFEDGSTPPIKKTTPKVKVQTPVQPPAPKEPLKVITPKVVFKNTTPKSRPPLAKSKLDKKRKSAGPDDVDVMVESEEWSPDIPKTNANGLKRPLDSPTEKDATSPPEKKSKIESKSRDGTDKDDNDEDGAMKGDSRRYTSSPIAKSSAASQNFMMNLNAGFIALLHAFQYLRVYELLRAGHVSKMWQFVASHHSLWETVRMKNSRVSDWKGFGRTLASRGTKNLDLRKMLVPESPEEQAKMWEELCIAVEGIKTLTKVDMGRCSPAAFIAMAVAAPQLESLVSMAINWKEKNAVHTAGSRKRGNEIDLLPLAKCKNLKELRLKTVTGTLEIKDLSVLSKLTNLTTLGLTTIKNLKGIENYLPVNITSLELGECSLLSKEVATEALPKLVNLKRLRLEKGQGECPTIALLEAISTLPDLVQLELINFDIKPGFDKALAKCTNLRTLLIIPTYVTQSATTNHVVMGGVAKLSKTLTYFIWGLTLELLKVTDLFIGQVENQKTGKSGQTPPKKGAGDSIPILKPSTAAEGGEMKEGSQAPSQVDILALPNLQRVLSTLLPSTKIKILKVPFSATWRQTVTEIP